jgi:adenylate cyclase
VCDKGSANGTFLNGAQISEDTAVDGDIVTFGRVAFKVVEVTPAEAAPPEPASMDFAPPPPDATIVKQVVVPDSGGFEAQPEDRPSSAQLQVDGETPEEFQARKLRMLLDISQALSRQKDVDKLLDKVVDITFQVMSVDRVSILMVEGV